ncbi:hypothetical protein OAO87_00780 [bacterium]|nr:hypothetical protein [bacterium]
MAARARGAEPWNEGRRRLGGGGCVVAAAAVAADAQHTRRMLAATAMRWRQAQAATAARRRWLRAETRRRRRAAIGDDSCDAAKAVAAGSERRSRTYMKIQRPLGRSGGLDERGGALYCFAPFSSSAQSSAAGVTRMITHSHPGGAALSATGVAHSRPRNAHVLIGSTLRSIA